MQPILHRCRSVLTSLLKRKTIAFLTCTILLFHAKCVWVCVCVCVCAHLPSHFSRICTVSPISSGRPCWTVPRKLASTATKRRQKKTPTWVFFFFVFVFLCLSFVMQSKKKEKKVLRHNTQRFGKKRRGGSINNLCRWNKIKAYKISVFPHKPKVVIHKTNLHKCAWRNAEYMRRSGCICGNTLHIRSLPNKPADFLETLIRW